MKYFPRAVSIVAAGEKVSSHEFLSSLIGVILEGGNFSVPSREDFEDLANQEKPYSIPQLVWINENNGFRSVGCIGDRLVFSPRGAHFDDLNEIPSFVYKRNGWMYESMEYTALFTDRCFGVVLQKQL